jgi:YceG-like family
VTAGPDWRDPYSGDDEAARERERRRAEREARRRERQAQLGERVREELTEASAPAPRAEATAPTRAAPAPPAPPAPTPGQRASDGGPPTSTPPRRPPAAAPPPRSAVRRRRIAAAIALAALAFVGLAVFVAAKRLGGSDEPAPAPPKAKKEISVTIPEGYSRDQVAAVAKEAGLEGDYMKATESFKGFDPGRYGADDPPNLEGFLFPATYAVFKDAKAEDLVAKQLEAFEQNIKGVDLSYAESKNLSVYDVLTIASMVEREVQVAEERPSVAAVIYNRLAAGMPLGIDATIRFEDSNYDEQLLQSRLEEDTPFNTRTNTGLPPTPIGSPGLASIEAASEPAKQDYLFFVVKPGTCGEHFFTASEDEFLAAEAEYQQALQEEGGSPTDC